MHVFIDDKVKKISVLMLNFYLLLCEASWWEDMQTISASVWSKSEDMQKGIPGKHFFSSLN